MENNSSSSLGSGNTTNVSNSNQIADNVKTRKRKAKTPDHGVRPLKIQATQRDVSAMTVNEIASQSAAWALQTVFDRDDDVDNTRRSSIRTKPEVIDLTKSSSPPSSTPWKRNSVASFVQISPSRPSVSPEKISKPTPIPVPSLVQSKLPFKRPAPLRGSFTKWDQMTANVAIRHANRGSIMTRLGDIEKMIKSDDRKAAFRALNSLTQDSAVMQAASREVFLKIRELEATLGKEESEQGIKQTALINSLKKENKELEDKLKKTMEQLNQLKFEKKKKKMVKKVG